MKAPTFIKRYSLGITAAVLGLLLIASPGTTYSAWTSTVSGASATTIKTAQLAVKAHTLPVAQRGVPYSFQLESNAGRGITVTWTSFVPLPTGITLSPSGLLSGTPTSTANTTQAMFQVTPNKGSSAMSSIDYLIVEAPPAVANPFYPYSNILNAVINKPVSLEAAFTGYPAPTVAVKSGTLPAGLTFNAYPHPQSTIVYIDGTPTEATAGSTVVFTVSNKFGSIDVPYTFQVDGVPVISTTTLPPLTVGIGYVQNLQASYATRSTTKWTVVSGELPPGVNLIASGILAGSATAGYPGTAAVPVTFRVTNAAGSADVTIPITTLWAPKISTTVIDQWGVGSAKSFQLVSQGNPAPTWTIRSGTLPAGLTMNAAGVISGTTSVVGTVTLGLRATNTYGFSDATLNLVVNPAPVIATSALPAGKVNQTYSFTLSTTPVAAMTWAIAAGTLPAGLSLNASTGVISGKPTTAGTTNLTIRATNAAGSSSTKALSLVVNPLVSTELVVNGGFESGATGWKMGGDGKAQNNKASAASGSWFASVGVDNNIESAVGIPVVPGETLTFSFKSWGSQSMVFDFQGGFVYFYNAAGQGLDYSVDFGTPTDAPASWKAFSKVGTVPAGAATAKVVLSGGYDGSVFAMFDDVSLKGMR